MYGNKKSKIYTGESTNAEYKNFGNFARRNNAFNFKKKDVVGIHGLPDNSQTDIYYWQNKEMLPNILNPLGTGVQALVREQMYDVNPIAGTNQFNGNLVSLATGWGPTNFSLAGNMMDIEDRMRGSMVPSQDPLSAQYAMSLLKGDPIQPNSIEGDASLNNFETPEARVRAAQAQGYDASLAEYGDPNGGTMTNLQKASEYRKMMAEKATKALKGTTFEDAIGGAVDDILSGRRPLNFQGKKVKMPEHVIRNHSRNMSMDTGVENEEEDERAPNASREDDNVEDDVGEAGDTTDANSGGNVPTGSMTDNRVGKSRKGQYNFVEANSTNAELNNIINKMQRTNAALLSELNSQGKKTSSAIDQLRMDINHANKGSLPYGALPSAVNEYRSYRAELEEVGKSVTSIVQENINAIRTTAQEAMDRSEFQLSSNKTAISNLLDSLQEFNLKRRGDLNSAAIRYTDMENELAALKDEMKVTRDAFMAQGQLNTDVLSTRAFNLEQAVVNFMNENKMSSFTNIVQKLIDDINPVLEQNTKIPHSLQALKTDLANIQNNLSMGNFQRGAMEARLKNTIESRLAEVKEEVIIQGLNTNEVVVNKINEAEDNLAGTFDNGIIDVLSGQREGMAFNASLAYGTNNEIARSMMITNHNMAITGQILSQRIRDASGQANIAANANYAYQRNAEANYREINNSMNMAEVVDDDLEEFHDAIGTSNEQRTLSIANNIASFANSVADTNIDNGTNAITISGIIPTAQEEMPLFRPLSLPHDTHDTGLHSSENMSEADNVDGEEQGRRHAQELALRAADNATRLQNFYNQSEVDFDREIDNFVTEAPYNNNYGRIEQMMPHAVSTFADPFAYLKFVNTALDLFPESQLAQIDLGSWPPQAGIGRDMARMGQMYNMMNTNKSILFTARSASEPDLLNFSSTLADYVAENLLALDYNLVEGKILGKILQHLINNEANIRASNERWLEVTTGLDQLIINFIDNFRQSFMGRSPTAAELDVRHLLTNQVTGLPSPVAAAALVYKRRRNASRNASTMEM